MTHELTGRCGKCAKVDCEDKRNGVLDCTGYIPDAGKPTYAQLQDTNSELRGQVDALTALHDTLQRDFDALTKLHAKCGKGREAGGIKKGRK